LLLIRKSSGLRLTFALVLIAAVMASLATPAMSQTLQDSGQDGESGDTDQSADITNTGDNSNQCVGVQPVSNTGNAMTDIDIIIETPAGYQYTKRFDLKDLIDELDLDLEDIGSSIEINPELTVECAQEIQQAATAANEADSGSCAWSWDGGWWCYWSTDGSWWFYGSDGSYTAYDAGYWYWDGYFYWWSDGYYWWWTDGYYWYYDGWDYYSTVGNVSAGTLEAARGTMPLVTLGALTLIGTAGILIRRNRRHNSEG
jgi:hypothetical protein